MCQRDSGGDDSGTPGSSHDKLQFGITADEVKASIDHCILQSQVKKEKLHSYWSTRKFTEMSFFLP